MKNTYYLLTEFYANRVQIKKVPPKRDSVND